MKLRLEESGPGSFDSLMQYTETVIKDNCEMKPDAFVTATREDPERRMARCMVMAILNSLGIEYDRD